MKTLKEFGETIDGNSDLWNKELETIKKSQSKSDNSIVEIKTELKVASDKLNNAEE